MIMRLKEQLLEKEVCFVVTILKRSLRSGGACRRAALLLSCVWLLFFAAPLCALDIVPFTTRNQSPLVLIHGLPSAGEARTLAAGETAFTSSLDIANGYTRGSRARTGDKIELDGESYRLTVGVNRGLTGGWEAGVELPYTAYRGGVFDHTIRQWHGALGLPQGNRRSVPNDRLLYTYERDGVELARLDRSTEGIGDLRLLASRELHQKEDWNAALRTSLKLPTGDSDKLLGSGGIDLALWLTGSWQKGTSMGTFALYGAGGPLFLFDGDVLPEQQNNLVGFGTLGFGWSPSGGSNLKVQIDGHTPFYRGSDLEEMGSSLQVSLGGSIPVGKRTTIDIVLGEDLYVNASPDAVFHLALRSRF